MAQLVLISKKTARAGVQNEDDLITIKPDNWKFSPTEHEKFTIRQVPQMTRDELGTLVTQLDNIVEYISVEPGNIDRREKWFHPSLNKWFILKEAPKFTINLKRINPPTWRKIEDGTYTKEQLQTAIQTFIDRTIEGFAENVEEEFIDGN
jgi:hypothetical protein